MVSFETPKNAFEVTKAVGEGLKLGVFTPSKDQIEQSRKRWSAVTKDLRIVAASPYVESDASIEGALWSYPNGERR